MSSTITISSEERELIHAGLNIRKNIIQTGCPTVGAADIERMGTQTAKDMGAELKALSNDQMRLLLKIEDLITKLYQPTVVL